MVNNGQKGSWGLLEVLFPAGSDRYCSHITVKMYKDAEQFAVASCPGGANADILRKLGVERALESRDMMKDYMARLEKKVRAK